MNKINRVGKCIIIILCTVQHCFTQAPFDCNGRMFRVIELDKATTLQEILISANDEVDMINLNTYEGFSLNGIAYNRRDNYIYGVIIQPDYQLIRIDGDYQLEILKPLPLPTNLSFVSGDITPDGRFLVMLGFGTTEKYNILALIDLTSPDYETKLYKTRSSSNTQILCADVAFHPTTNVLYGFDHSEGRLITIDLESKTIDNRTFPKLSDLQGNVPSLFFDTKGNLYGVGAKSNTPTNRYFFKMNPNTGRAILLEHLGIETFQDACSCPVQVGLLNRVSQRTGFSCTTLTFEVTLINKTNRALHGLSLENQFPEAVTIQEVSNLTFQGILQYQDNHLTIRNLILPIGDYKFTIKVVLDTPTTTQALQNQVVLSGESLKQLFGKEELLSDDPETLVFNDPTLFSLEHLKVAFEKTKLFICEGKSLTIQPIVEGDWLTYQWNTGSSARAIIVNQPGRYEVEVSTGCETASGSIDVLYETITMTLGDDVEAEVGEQLEIKPIIDAASGISNYHWISNSTMDFCINCPTLKVALEEGTNFSLTIETETGCLTKDEIQITLTGFSLYAPNAFSPNGDNLNDHFYLQSPKTYIVQQFQVFDRWGNQLVERMNTTTNQPELGWNGKHRDGNLIPGVYVWKATVINKAGKPISKQGEVNLFLEHISY